MITSCHKLFKIIKTDFVDKNRQVLTKMSKIIKKRQQALLRMAEKFKKS